MFLKLSLKTLCVGDDHIDVCMVVVTFILAVVVVLVDSCGVLFVIAFDFKPSKDPIRKPTSL